jgi:hypothetical protein
MRDFSAFRAVSLKGSLPPVFTIAPARHNDATSAAVHADNGEIFI